MNKHNINYFSEKVTFTLKNKKIIKNWIISAIKEENKIPGNINYVFCNDNYLLDLNKKYLGKNTFTDVLTFNYSENNKYISGDIYISIDRVKENSKKFNTNIKDELHRVMIHGILHLINYNDKNEEEKMIMRQKEDYYLSLL